MKTLTVPLLALVGLVVQTTAAVTVLGLFVPAYAPPADWPQDPNTWKTYQPWRGSAYVIR